MNSVVIGLTGQSGAGKTTVSRVFSENGFSVINADTAAREAVVTGSPCLAELSESFGRDIILPDGSLDRKKLAGIVFADRERLAVMNSIMYPHIIRLIEEKIEKLRSEGAEYILLDAPTLFEAGADKMCSRIISVTAREDIRTERIAARDKIPRERIKERFSSQLSEEFFTAHSDYVIENNGSSETLEKKAAEAARKIKEYSENDNTDSFPEASGNGGCGRPQSP